MPSNLRSVQVLKPSPIFPNTEISRSKCSAKWLVDAVRATSGWTDLPSSLPRNDADLSNSNFGAARTTCSKWSRQSAPAVLLPYKLPVMRHKHATLYDAEHENKPTDGVESIGYRISYVVV